MKTLSTLLLLFCALTFQAQELNFTHRLTFENDTITSIKPCNCSIYMDVEVSIVTDNTFNDKIYILMGTNKLIKKYKYYYTYTVDVKVDNKVFNIVMDVIKDNKGLIFYNKYKSKGIGYVVKKQ